MRNKKTNHVVRVAEVCYKKFVSSHKPYNNLVFKQICKKAVHNGEYKIDSFESYEAYIRQELRLHFLDKIKNTNKINKASTTF